MKTRAAQVATYDHVAKLVQSVLPSMIAAFETEKKPLSKAQTQARVAILKQLQVCNDDIQYGTKKEHVALASWAARNLLELWIWSRYLTKSDENLASMTPLLKRAM